MTKGSSSSPQADPQRIYGEELDPACVLLFEAAQKLNDFRVSETSKRIQKQKPTSMYEYRMTIEGIKIHLSQASQIISKVSSLLLQLIDAEHSNKILLLGKKKRKLDAIILTINSTNARLTDTIHSRSLRSIIDPSMSFTTDEHAMWEYEIRSICRRCDELQCLLFENDI